MKTPVIYNDDNKGNDAVQREVQKRQEFGRWWREWATPRNVDNGWIREIAYEAWKAGRRGE